MQKLFVSAVALSMASSTFDNSAFAEIIKTDAGLAGKSFCWSSGYDRETYNRDHTYLYYYHPDVYKVETYKGTGTISKDGTVTIKISGGSTKVRRYDMIDREHVKELTGTLMNFWGAPGKVC